MASSPTLLQFRNHTHFEVVQDRAGNLAYENKKHGWVRLEQPVAGTAATAWSPDDVSQKIKDVQNLQSHYGRSDLYPRAWSNAKADFDFSVTQFNTLAEGLSAGPPAQPPFASTHTNETTTFGGFSALPHPQISLDFEHRKWRLLEVILGYDLIAMQEVDRFHGFFEPMLKLFGYKGVFVPKRHSPCVNFGYYSDGCCLFYKQDAFDLVETKEGSFSASNQVYLNVQLKHKATGKVIRVVVTHLKAKNIRANERIRREQVKELIDLVNTEQDKLPTLILGDLNADPPNRNEFSEAAVSALVRDFESAYDLEDLEYYTTWKIRENKTFKRVIDYIFGRDLKFVATLDVPLEMEPTKLPGLRFPSDHLNIAARIKL